jgi:hypothetical protein
MRAMLRAVHRFRSRANRQNIVVCTSAAMGRAAHAHVGPIRRGDVMPTYRMVYGDEEQVVQETFDDVEVQREDGWVVLFRGSDAILRVQEQHVQSLDLVTE